MGSSENVLEEASMQTPEGYGGLRIDGEQDVFLFPGQGSQKPGMGGALLDLPEAVETFACASDLFGFDVADVALAGSEELLNDTYHAQAAILALSVSLARIVRSRHVAGGAVLGFSLGQIAALYAAGMLDAEQLFGLAKARADYMADAAAERPGAMCALLGADAPSVQALCERYAQGGVLVPANYNAPGQIVISGSADAVDRAQEAWTADKKKAVRLATSGAFHSPLMEDAARALSAYLQNVGFSEPDIPLICNTDARPLDVASVRERLAAHLTAPVLFEQSIVNLRHCGAQRFTELGFGGVLVGLVKRIDRGTVRTKVEDAQTLETYLLEQQSKEED